MISGETLPWVSSIFLGLALFLTFYSWLPIWDFIAAKYIADISPSLDALGIDRKKLPMLLRIWGIGLISIFFRFAGAASADSFVIRGRLFDLHGTSLVSFQRDSKEAGSIA